MSAYALPGLFPPIECTSSAYNSSGETSIKYPIDKSENNHCSSGDCSTAAPCSSLARPLHVREETTQHISLASRRSSRINVLGDAVKASVGKLSHILGTGDTSPNSPSSSIAVTEAKIDPVRLVQCVTSSQQHHQQKGGKTLRKRGSRERLDAHHQHHSPSSKKAAATEDGNNNPHDEAIEFELSISLNGRRYTATRTMQCIVKLRNDLIREMNTRRRWLQSTVTGSSGSNCAPTNASAPGSYGGSFVQPLPKEVFEIPEIPPLSREHESNVNAGSGGNNFVGRGFSMLHAMATSYIPAMEGWLKNVLTIVPQDSQCLLDFLWEPMKDGMPELEAAFPSSLSLSGLDSIKELDYNTGDDDSEDEWER